MCGTLKKPQCHDDLRRIMADVRAARYGPGVAGAMVKSHVTAAFANEVFMGFFKAFEVDERGGLTSNALEHQRLQAWQVITEVFTWHVAVNSLKGVSMKRPVCLSSLWQAMIYGAATARRCWSSAEGLFLGGRSFAGGGVGRGDAIGSRNGSRLYDSRDGGTAGLGATTAASAASRTAEQPGEANVWLLLAATRCAGASQ